MTASSFQQSGDHAFMKSYGQQIVLLTLGPILALAIGVIVLFVSGRMSYSVFNARRWPSEDGNTGTHILHGLLLAAVALLLCNTLLYIWDAVKHKLQYTAFLFAIAVIIIVIWATDICFGWMSGFLAGSPEVLRHLNEGVAVIIFMIFAVMDYSLYKDFVVTEGDANSSNSAVEKDTFLLQLAVIDVPVMLGLIATIACTHFFIETSAALGSGAERAAFVTGFNSGSLVMHLAVSQGIFVWIYARYYLRIYRNWQDVNPNAV